MTTFSSRFDPLIARYAGSVGVDWLLVKAQIKQESNFNPNARSFAGAMGLMQIMPATMKELNGGIMPNNPYDPDLNIRLGTKYLGQMLRMFGSSVTLALAAYNAGPGNVRKYNGVPPFSETQNYIKNILKYWGELKGTPGASTGNLPVPAPKPSIFTSAIGGGTAVLNAPPWLIYAGAGLAVIIIISLLLKHLKTEEPAYG